MRISRYKKISVLSLLKTEQSLILGIAKPFDFIHFFINKYNDWFLRLFPFLLFFFIVNLGISQNINNLELEVLDEEDGLSSHWIQDIALDSTGYLWVSTYDGLNRYDGYNFKIFKHKENESSSLLHDGGQSIYVDYNGVVWVSYSEGGVSSFNSDCQCFTHYKTPKISKDLKTDRSFGIKFIDQQRNLWYSGNGLGLNIFYPKQNLIKHFDLPFLSDTKNDKEETEVNTVNAIYESKEGSIWLCSQNGFYRFDKQTMTFDYKREVNSLHAFYKLIPEGNDGFWLSSWIGGITYFDLKSETFKHFPLAGGDKKKVGYYNLIDDIAHRNDTTFWVVSSDKGLGIFDKKAGKFEFPSPSKMGYSQSLFFPHKILCLSNQSFFLVDENALLKYNPYAKLFNFKTLPITESQHGDLFQIRKIIENPQREEVYFATELGNGLNILDSKTGELSALPIETHPARDKKMRVLDLISDEEGKMWLLSRDYLHEFDYVHKKLIKVSQVFEEEEYEKTAMFKYFIQNSKNQIWVLTNEGGIYPFSPQKRKLSSKLNEAKKGAKTIEKIYTATFDKQDNLWIQGNQSLAYYPKGSDICTFITDKQVLEWLKGSIKGIRADTSGNIWVGISGKGLLKVDCQDMTHINYRLFSTQDGLPSNNFNVIGSDFMDNVWISTLMGVACMNTNTYQVKTFNQSVGMDKFTMGVRFHKSNYPNFYITAPGKYCKVDYNELNRYIPPPKTYISSFKILNIEKKIALNGSQTLTLSPEENVFSFEFSCIDFTDQSHHEFAYMLEGWDKDWVQVGRMRYVGYTNLDGGHYTFKVKGKNREGVWGNTVSIPIFIETPFYKKTGFIILSMFLFVAVVYVIYLYRIKQIERTEKLKTEFKERLAETRMQALRAQMNPHFIFNCLNSINSYIIKSDIKTASLYLTRFAKLIRLILDNSQHKQIPLSDELAALKLYIQLEVFRFEKKIEYEIIVEDEVDVDNIEVPPLLFQPYIENAIWHGLLHKESQGNLWVHLSQTDDIITCKITDNGIGRAKASEYKSKTTSTRNSLGMKITEERLQVHGKENAKSGTQTIKDLFDAEGNACGTEVIITLYV